PRVSPQRRREQTSSGWLWHQASGPTCDGQRVADSFGKDPFDKWCRDKLADSDDFSFSDGGTGPFPVRSRRFVSSNKAQHTFAQRQRVVPLSHGVNILGLFSRGDGSLPGVLLTQSDRTCDTRHQSIRRNVSRFSRGGAESFLGSDWAGPGGGEIR